MRNFNLILFYCIIESALSWRVLIDLISRHRAKQGLQATTIDTDFRGGNFEETNSSNNNNVDDDIDDEDSLLLQPGSNIEGFTLLSETILYDNWRRLLSRKVRLPSGLKVDFEIVSQRGTDQAVLIFVWDTKSQTTTLIREYMPSTHCKMIGLAAGMVEKDKHETILTAAQHELEEECHLIGGEWIQLTQQPVIMDKYSTTALSVYLVINPITCDIYKERDITEEGMEVIHRVSIEELYDFMNTQMTVVGSWASMLALRRLQEMGEIL